SDLIKQLIVYGYEVFAFTCEYNDKQLVEISALGAKPVTYKMSRGGLNPFSDIKALFNLKSEIEKIKPDLVLSYFTKPVVYGSLASKFSKVPKIIGMIEGLGTPFTEHSNGQSLKVKFIKFFQITLYRLVFPFIDKIIFLNKDDPQDLIYKNKIKHKNNSVNILGPIGLNLNDYPYMKWQESSTISFIFVARLIAEKGIFEFVEAAKIVKQKYK
ncbi:glycosyltransferase, partial [Acinetobacter baumannii]